MKMCTLVGYNSTKFGGNRTKDLEVGPERQTGRFLYTPQTTFAGGIIKITLKRILLSIEIYPCYASLDLEILRQFSMHFVIANSPT
jgi:hypothetical protein